ncbi:TauD/TfdA family dioxygenase [Streptomyces syringium]|uniref:TauD/TfdA family dioxygenase n=1 Tax=Streptomyces syringium TaxID=76729 RepID=UPI003D901186
MPQEGDAAVPASRASTPDERPHSQPSLPITAIVDARQSRAVERSAAGLHKRGLVSLKGLDDRESVARFTAQIMTVQRQRSDGPDGLTSLTHPAQFGSRSTERIASSGLAPRTAGSALVHPPGLLLLACLRAPAQGGHVRLVDGKKLYIYMTQRCPAAAAVFSAASAGFFGGSGGVTAPAFCRRGDGRVSLRLAPDSAVRWCAEAKTHLPQLQDALARNEITVKLQAGEGLLVDNLRWASGRTTSVGPYQFMRALGFPHDNRPTGVLPTQPAPGGTA